MMTSLEVVVELAYVSVRAFVVLARYVTRSVVQIHLIVRLIPKNGAFLTKSRLVEHWRRLVDNLQLRLTFVVAALLPLPCVLAPHWHSLLPVVRLRDGLVELRVRLLVISPTENFNFLTY